MFKQAKFFISFIGPYKKATFALLALMVLAAFFEIIGLSLMIPLIGTIVGENMMGALTSSSMQTLSRFFSEHVSKEMRTAVICGVFIFIFVVKNIVIYIKMVLTAYYQKSVRSYWSIALLDKYLHAEYDFIISEKKGRLINNLFHETYVCSKFVGKLIFFFSKATMAIFIYIMLLFANWKLTLIFTLIIGTATIIFGVLSRKPVEVAGQKRLALIQDVTSEGEQAINSIRQVKLFSAEKRILKEFSKMYDSWGKILTKLSFFESLPVPAGEVMIIVGFSSILVYCEYIANISIAGILPELAFGVISCGRLYQNASTLIADRVWFTGFMPSVKLIGSILADDMIKKEVLKDGKKIEKLQGDIVFKDLTFSYDKEKMILNNINLKIEKNKITAIVGKSGSGKSTLVDLLCGLYKGYEGKILIGEDEMGELSLSSWRKIIGFVSQETILLHSSIRENLLFGNPDATEEEIINAAKQAYAHDFIMNLPQGYDTVAGDSGVKISGGQRQRITVARALIRSPQILIFDEATSSLDAETERLMQQSIDSLSGEKTIIIISHRLSTIKNADTIFFLEKGSIVESGSYEALVQKKGFFQSMLFEDMSKVNVN